MLSFSATAQRTFIKHYGTSSSEYGTSLTLADSSGILVCQTVSSASNVFAGIVKTDANGHRLWDRTYNFDGTNVIKKVLRWGDGYLILLSTWYITNSKIVLMRINLNGDILWARKYSASNADLASGLSISGDKFIITATADYNIGSHYPKVLWIQTDTNGVPLRSKMYGAQYMISAMSSEVNGQGKTGIVCESNSFGTGSFSFHNIVAIQLDTAGNIEWSKSFGTYYDDQVNSIVPDSTDWLFAGRSYFLSYEYDASLFRVDGNGDLVMNNFYDAGTSNGEVFRALITKPGGRSVIVGDAGTFDERNINLLSVDRDGSIQWANEFPVSIQFTNYPFDIVALPNDSGYLFTGDVRPPTHFRDAALFRTDSSGHVFCQTQPIVFSPRADTVEVLDVTLQDRSFTLTSDPTTWTEYVFLLAERTICSFPAADFSYTTDTICPLLCFNFNSESVNAISWQWSFPGGQPASSNASQPPPVCYDSAGTYTVSLLVSDGVNSDTKYMTLSLESFCDTLKPLVIPNVISPNNDFFNDQFLIKNLNEKFQLSIFNRWGQMVFQSSSMNTLWPDRNSDISNGVYYYILEVYTPAPGKKYHGSILVIG